MDELEALRAFRADVEPLPAEVRERARVRLGRPHARRRAVVVAAVALAAAVVASAALGLGDRVADLVSGEPAPPPVRRQIALVEQVRGELIPRARHEPRLLAERTRLLTTLQTSVTPVHVWVTPLRGGGRCTFVQIVGTELPDGRPNLSTGPCSLPAEAARAFNPGHRVTNVGGGREGPYLRLVAAAVSPTVTEVRLELKDGTSMPLPLLREFAFAELPPGRDGDAVVALDADGRELDRFPLRGPRLQEFPRPTGPYRTLVEIETSKGFPASLNLAPGPGDDRCVELRFRGTRSGGCGPYATDGVFASPTQIGAAPEGVLLLNGFTGPRTARLEVRYENGDREPIPLAEGFFLVEVPPARFAEGRRPVAVVALAADGRELARRNLGPWRRGDG